jgi:hypothetical protein
METLQDIWSACMKDNNPISGFLAFCVLMAILLFPAVCPLGTLHVALLATWPTYRDSYSYNVSFLNVIVEDEPKDCDFLHAPIGDKDCHYNRVSGKIGHKVYVPWVREATEEAAERRLTEKAAREEAEEAREREYRGQMTQADHQEADRHDAQPEVYSPDAHGNTCLPHQRSENAQGEVVCPEGQVQLHGQY